MNKQFWKAALARCLHTVAQTALGMIGATLLIEKVNWLAVLSASALAGVVSILKSIAFGMPETAKPKTVTNTVEKRIYLDEDGREIDPNDLMVEPDGTITVLAYDEDEWDENGDPKPSEPGGDEDGSD